MHEQQERVPATVVHVKLRPGKEKGGLNMCPHPTQHPHPRTLPYVRFPTSTPLQLSLIAPARISLALAVCSFTSTVGRAMCVGLREWSGIGS